MSDGNGFVGPDDALLSPRHFGQQTAPCPTNTPTSTPTPCPGTCPTDTPTATPSRTPTRIPFPTITPTGTATPVPIPCESQCDLSGLWHMDTTSGSAAMPTGNCSSSLTQLTETTFSGPLSCTGGSVGTIDVTIDLASSAISSEATIVGLEQPIYGSGQLSANGDTIVGQWCYENCTSSGGAISHRIPDLYAVPVTRDNGGTLATALGDLLTVPSGALPSDQTITVHLEPLPVAPRRATALCVPRTTLNRTD